MLGLRVRGRGGRDRTATVAAPISAFLWGSTPFLCARAKKWGGIGSREERLPPKKTAPPHPPPTSTSPLQKSGEERPVYRGSSAHANGGATRVKKRFSLAARQRFFGQAPKKWGRKAAGGNDHRPRKRRTRTKHNDEAALSCAVTCAPFYLAIDRTGPARSTPFLCSCAKKRGGAPKKRAFGCRHGTCSVPPASPTDSKPQHPHRLRQADLSARSTTKPLPKLGEDE